MVLIAPSIFQCADSELEQAVKSMPNADLIHIDVAHPDFLTTFGGDTDDGKPSLLWDESYLDRVHRALCLSKSTADLDIHLMVPNPIKHIERYATMAPEYITFHSEATDGPKDVIREIRAYGANPGIAVNPDTPLSSIRDHLEELNGYRQDKSLVLLMSVVPGKGGQSYIPQVTQKIADLRKVIDERGYDNIKIEVDGGIKLDNHFNPIMAGADILVSGSGVLKHPDYSPKEAIDKMRDVVVLGSDHAGYHLKKVLKCHLDEQRIPHKDLGCFNELKVDYPMFAGNVAEAIQGGEYARGILVCGSGQGIAMAANRYKGIRAARCVDAEDARETRRHNDCNVLVLRGGGRTNITGATNIFTAWYHTPTEANENEGERHLRRIQQLDKFGS
jgi:ribulose-phosphate 3-epimerase